jgi:pimeloyl-ACP methyl ester carboxylesterase
MEEQRRDTLKQLAAGAGLLASGAGLLAQASAQNTDREAGMSEKRDFVLVHGAWSGGWCYARVAELLRARGHRVFTPTLAGHGERSHLTGQPINWSTHVRDVMNVISFERLNDVVLCGHSYGGTVVGGVADAIPERIASLVYIDAIIPESGKAVIDFSTPQQISALLASAGKNGWQLPPWPSGANAIDRAMVDALQTPFPFAAFCERMPLTGAYMNIRKTTYIYAQRQNSQVQRWYEQARKARGWVVEEVPSSHDIMLDAPKELADFLLKAAA